ncbi:MAG: hypothetical protein E4H20_08310 [Spirochaetales bacterium]|nr:MAG: hypothetical protein E4H20_08310 [Spirochaetales bacterium]
MTAKFRERLLKAMFFSACASSAGVTWLVWTGSGAGGGGAIRGLPPLQEAVPVYAATAGLVACVLYALVLIGIIAFRAGKSASPEIFFFAVWAFGLSLELGQVMAIWMSYSGAALSTVSLSSRLALFGRYLSLMGLFMGSIFSVGLKQERMGLLLSAAILVALFFGTIHPLNVVTAETGVIVELGYGRLMRFFEISIMCLIGVNYTLAWRENRDKAFLRAGLGLALCVPAVWILRAVTSIPMVFAALPFLILGTWLYFKNLFVYYLWR